MQTAIVIGGGIAGSVTAIALRSPGLCQADVDGRRRATACHSLAHRYG